jgi:uracil-DNA glycosylase
MPRKAPKKAAKAAPSLFPEDDAPAASGSPPEHFPAPSKWADALAPEFAAPYFTQLQQFVAEERATQTVFPPEPDVYNAFRYAPLESIRVVILGQDPYPTPGHAHGLCFSVRPGVVLPASLRNIYKELQTDLGLAPAKHGYLAAWAAQGVFLLNAVLTVRSGKPASHANKGWETFTDAALRAVNGLTRPVVFLLWGAYAQKKTKLIDEARHVVLKSAHPSPLSASNGFFGSKPFSKINAALTKAGEPTIDWKLPEKAEEKPERG